ncbi:F-box/kelch-repeat protein-like [Dorcoceras hygrometricum]|uniref:F-box/kelch-repeat protein-like n=1 Tax=Dorcoceras hygrometricum TaxID=472368 RepID=A0A2Z7C1W7_9LAMI|nr:F-box/kelch-repeat protein-like [Dorcoceras hygrometricum]
MKICWFWFELKLLLVDFVFSARLNEEVTRVSQHFGLLTIISADAFVKRDQQMARLCESVEVTSFGLVDASSFCVISRNQQIDCIRERELSAALSCFGLRELLSADGCYGVV